MSDRREKRASAPWCWICGGKLAMGGWQYVDHLGEDGHVHPVHATCATAERNARDDVLRERYGTDALGCIHCGTGGCEYCCPAKDKGP